MKLTKKDYNKIVKALTKAGYKAEDVYPALEQSGFAVSIKGKVYEGIYASRVIAMMHQQQEKAIALEL
jgi:hypothetical protein